MMFNDSSGGSGLIQECELLTGLGDAQISGNTSKLKHFTRLINATYHQVVTMILSSMDDWDYDDSNHTDYPIITTSLVANQQDYSLQSSLKILKIKRVEVSYDGGASWRLAEPIDVNEIRTATDTSSISTYFSQSSPKYDVQNNALFLYPIPTAASTNGLKVWISREIDEFTTSDTAQEPGIDETFHRMLAVGASLKYGVAKRLDNKADLAAEMADYEMRLRNYYGKKQSDRDVIQLRGLYVDYR